MRQIVVLIISVVAAVAGPFFPKVALWGYIWFALSRPDIFSYTKGRIAYSELIAIGLLIGSFRYLFNAGKAWLLNPVSRLLIVLELFVYLSTIGSAFPEITYVTYVQFLKMSVIAMVIPLIVTTVEDLKAVYIVAAVSLGIWGFWQGTTAVLRVKPIVVGIGGSMQGNNEFACGLVMVIPFCWYSRLVVKSPLLRAVLLAMTFGCMAAVLMTFSRAGAISLLVLIIMVAIQAKRKTLTFLLIGLAVAPTLYIAGNRFTDRMSTLSNYEADQSAMSRIVVAKAALQVAAEHPWFGVGIGAVNFVAAAKPYMPPGSHNYIVHNSYLEILVHCGVFALIIFVYLLISTTWRSWRSARKWLNSRPDLYPYPRALQLSLTAYMIESIFHPRATFDFLYLILMFAAAWHTIERSLLQEQAVVQPPLRVPLSAKSVAAAPERRTLESGRTKAIRST
jgi:putative inorganic carbon (hco3(-)) transporter